MEATSEVIEKAVQQFYHESSIPPQVHEWLKAVQLSPDGWKFSWDLLHPSKSLEVQYFGASTLHVKVSRFWFELNTDQYDSFKEKLLEWIINYVTCQRLVHSRLCITFASYIIHTIDGHWKSAISDVINYFDVKNFPNVSSQDLVKTLLLILVAVPDEFRSTYIKREKKGLVNHELSSSSSIVFNLLLKISLNLENHSTDVRNSCIKCFKNWIAFEKDLLDIECFIPYLLKCIHDDEMSEICQETLANIILHPNLSRFPTLINKLIQYLLLLEPLLSKSKEENDVNLCSVIYGVIATFCEHHSKHLLDQMYENPNTKDQILRLISIMLDCSKTPGQFPVEETCSEVTFSFWFILQDDIMTAEPNKTALYLQYMVPVYKSLVEILMFKVCYPSDQLFESWNSDEKNQFRCYRQDISDTLMHCYNILKESMLNILLSHLTVIVQTCNPNQWQELEACLYAFQAVSEAVEIDEAKFVPAFFSSLSKISLNHVKVSITALDAIGSYAEWIRIHPEVLSQVIPVLLVGLQNTEIAPSATLALKELSRDCKVSMTPYVDSILVATREVLQTDSIRSNEKIRLAATIGSVLSVLPTATIITYLNELLFPCVHKLEVISSQAPNLNMKNDLLLCLNLLSMLFSTLDTQLANEMDENEHISKNQNNFEEPPVLIILQKIMPIVVKIGLLWCQDAEVSKSICLLLKRSSSTLLEKFQPILPMTLEFLIQMHQRVPTNHCIEISKQLILLFSEAEYHHLIKPYFIQMINLTLEFVNKDFRNNTDMVESALQILSQILKKQSKLFMESSVPFNALFTLGMNALGLPEAPTVKAASQFLAGFISKSRENNDMSDVVNNNGEILLGYLLKIIGGEASRCMVDYTPDILLALNKKYFDNLCRWMNSFINNGILPSPNISREQKEHYTRRILKERNNKRKLLEIVKEYTLLCRGLIDTDYGRQTF